MSDYYEPCEVAEGPISMERRCQIPGCRTLFTAPALDELRCPDCRAARHAAPAAHCSLYGSTAALCAGA